ncbi:hypothetical protein HHI36_000052 [Cryptolaemus montrouzieri]|uniref:Uncharacterized protein n=1 Tax=Cryptolaemus montrouzieri TaxID=559131 RepID=A0ABD2P497_9CUCU
MVFDSKCKEIICDLKTFMEKEACNGLRFPLIQVINRVCKAVNTSASTVKRIKKKGFVVLSGEGSDFSNPQKRRRSFPKTEIEVGRDDFISNHFHNYHIIRKESPTVKRLLVTSKEDN